jgi:prepilin signal peptidase PulO-like enzyme (type II secretory pathway)
MTWLTSGALGILLLAATVWDVRSRRVPLWLTLGGTVIGLTLSILGGTHVFTLGILGFAAGIILLLPLVLRSGFGGAWLGWPTVLWAAWWSALVGAGLALVYWRHGNNSLPYVPAIAAGAIVTLLLTAT